MSADPTLVGRVERRLPIIVVVHLARAERPDTDADQSEKTYTDNISLHGARVISRFHWEPGEVSATGRRTPRLRCELQDRAISWSILERFGGA